MQERSPSSWVFRGSEVRIGAFRCPAWHSLWRVDNLIEDGPEIVFARNPVRIRRDRGGDEVADSTRVMLYNQGEVYRRERVVDDGERADWFSFSPEAIAGALDGVDPSVRDRGARVWGLDSAPVDARVYAWQRAIFEAAEQGGVEPVWIEEQAMALLRRIACGAAGGRRRASERASRADTRRAHAEAVGLAKRHLATRFRERVTLEEVASAAHVSAFHLCRVFRSATGLTMHRYVEQLRLRASLEEVGERRGDLLSLALELGFSSHAHFTGAFAKAFGMPPSAVSGRGEARRLAREMSNRMEAGA